MIADGQIALVLYFLNPSAALFYLLAVIANVMETEYKGYYVLGIAVFGVISRMADITGLSRNRM